MCLRKHHSFHHGIMGTEDGQPSSPLGCHSQETNLVTSAACPFPLRGTHPAPGLMSPGLTLGSTWAVFFIQEDRD